VRPTAPVAPVAQRTTASGPRPLLLVDDSAVVRAKLRKLFEGAGYPVLLARDGLEALAAVEQGQPALLITDLEMPNLDGVALIAELHSRGLTTRLPVLAITGHEDLQARLALLPGVQGLYRKPWDDAELLARVLALVGQPASLLTH
ncbi:MAG: hypothetical protein CFE45_22855, partial [Burkholderiales bacterium PBB5]